MMEERDDMDAQGGATGFEPDGTPAGLPRSAFARLVVSTIRTANDITRETVEEVEESTRVLSTLFSQLIENSEVQTSRLGDLVDQIGTIKKDGQAVDIVSLPHILQESLEEITERILALSRQGVTLIYSLDEILDEVSELSSCIDEIEAINRQTRLLSLNAQIESERAGGNSGGSKVISSEMHGLSKRIDSLAERMRNSIGSVSGKINVVITSIRDEYQKMSDIGAMDLTKQIDAKDHIESLLVALVERNNLVTEALNQSTEMSRSISDDINEVVMSMQFQDRTKQRSEAVVMAFDAIAEFLDSTPAEMVDETACDALSHQIVDGITLSDVRNRFRAELLDDVDDPDGQTGSDDSGGSDIELF